MKNEYDIKKLGLDLELKAIKHSKFASEETNCYQANLYYEGKPLSVVSNDGRGGCDYVYKHKNCKLSSEDYRATVKHIEKTLETVEIKYPSDWGIAGSYKLNLEGWCSDQVTKFLQARDLKNLLNKSIVFMEDCKFYIVKWKWSVGAENELKKKEPKARVLNSMPFDEALQLYIGTATN